MKLNSITGKQLNMFEVKVLSYGENIARDKMAIQSSTLKDTTDASKSVDGDETTFSHTNDVNPFWEVNLDGPYPIQSVVIVNRWCQNPSDENGCLCRLSHSVLSILDENGDWVASQFIGGTCGQLEVNVAFSCE